MNTKISEAQDTKGLWTVQRIVLSVGILVAGVAGALLPPGTTFYLLAAAASFLAATILGVMAWRYSRSALAIVVAGGASALLAVLMVLRAVWNVTASTPTSITTVTVTGTLVALMGVTYLPRIYRDGDVTVDAFSVRAAFDGIIVALALFIPFWFLSSGFISRNGIAMFICSAMVGSLSLARLAQEEHRSLIRAALALALILGAALIIHAPDQVWGTVGQGLMVAGALGQAWVLPSAEPLNANQNRVFESDDPWPSIVLIAVLATAVYLWNDQLGQWQAIALIMGSAVTLAVRLLLGLKAEALVRHQVATLVYADPLTGIGNRRALMERLRFGPGWVLSLDLDSFKAVNDQFGHEAGDIVLCRFVERVRNVLPKGADFYRIGGDEFAVVVSNNVRNIRGLAREVVACGPDPSHSEISVSVGLAPFSQGENPAGALRGSDIALQEAKEQGKNRAAVLDDAMLSERMRDLNIGSRLRGGGLDDIFVVYQPLVAMGWQDNPVIGVEALARWDDRELGSVSPSEFVPICERQGLIPQLGLTVMRQALEQLRIWMDQGTPIQISINVSVLQLRDEHVVAQMERLLAVEPELAKWIVIEVTETVFSDDDRAVNSLRQLRALGLCTALDDFGTGASTLTRLRHLPIDILKIDRSLVMGAGTDESADAILDMVATLGRRMSMVLVAEGLEDPLATQRCAQLGYAVGQGFIFSRPVPANMLPELPRLQRPAMPRRTKVDALWTQSAMAAGGTPQVTYDEDHNQHAAR